VFFTIFVVGTIPEDWWFYLSWLAITCISIFVIYTSLPGVDPNPEISVFYYTYRFLGAAYNHYANGNPNKELAS
jgi:hypothetical protein